MRGFAILSAVLFFATGLSAQQKEIDSLLVELKSHTKEDTVRFNLLSGLAFRYSLTDPGKGLQTSDEAIVLAKRLNDKKALATAYSQKGLNHSAQSEDSLALIMHRAAYDIYREINYQLGQARCLNNIAIIYVNTSEFVKALESHNEAYKILEQIKDSVRMAASLANIGVVYNYLADYPRALEHYLRSLSITKKLDKNKEAISLGNIGIIYKKIGKNDLALQYYNRAMTIQQETGNKIDLANTLNNIGSLYDNMDSTEKALQYYNESMNIYTALNNKRGIANNLTDMGIVYSSGGNYYAAINSYMRAIRIYEEIDNKVNLSIALNSTGDLLLKAPVTILSQFKIPATERYAKALEYQQKALKLAKESEATDRQVTALRSISETYELQGEFSKALIAYKQYALLKDSILNDEKREEIFRKQMRFEQDKKEAVLNAEHAAEIRQQKTIRNFFIAGAAIIVFASAILFISYKRRRDAIAKKNDAELKAQIADTEMKVMRLQMNPHFIFNSLNSIADYIAKNNPREADAYLSKFAKVMRMTLENSEQQLISLNQDLKALDLYMQLEAKRLNNKFRYEIKVAEEIDKENTLVPPMIFQPFIENSIWHGIAKKEGQGHIMVDISKEGEMLRCRIDDDGIGLKKAESIKQQTEEKKQSLGMKITKARIEILNRLKGSNATVTVIDKLQGVTAELKLPIETNF